MGKAELKIEMDASDVARAEAAGVDLVGVAKSAMDRAIAALDSDVRAAQWARDNAAAIEAHRKQIEEHGVFGEDFRTW